MDEPSWRERLIGNGDLVVMPYMLPIVLTVSAVLMYAGSVTSAESPIEQHSSRADFDLVLREVEAAQVELVNGRADRFKSLWSHGEDVTLSGGLGGAIAKGWPAVSARLDWVATQYVDASRRHQEVSRYVGKDIAYVVLRETIRFKDPKDAKPAVQELRVTQIFRRERQRWLIVHRHADSQVTAE